MYLYLSSPTVETVTITKGEETYTQSISEPFIFDVGKCEFGEKVSVELDTSASDSDESYINIYAYCLDQDVYKRQTVSCSINYTVLSVFCSR